VQLQLRVPAAGHSRLYPLMRRTRAHACLTALSYFPQAYRGKCRGGRAEEMSPCTQLVFARPRGISTGSSISAVASVRYSARARTSHAHQHAYAYWYSHHALNAPVRAPRFYVRDRERNRLAGKHLAAACSFIREVALRYFGFRYFAHNLADVFLTMRGRMDLLDSRLAS